MRPLEVNTRTNFDQILINLGYEIDETKVSCNVFKERTKTREQSQLFKRKRPDYIIYETNSNNPLAIVEAKKIGVDLTDALNQAIDYANKISCPLAFATNDTFFIGYHIKDQKFLKIDGIDLQQFVTEETLMTFIKEGSEIVKNPVSATFTKEEVMLIFKKINNLLRKEGLRTGQERFTAISDLLFLKLLSEQNDIGEFIGNNKVIIHGKYSWNTLKDKPDDELIDFLNDSIRPRLIGKYGEIFNNQFAIKKSDVLRKLIDLLDPLNLSDADTDIKGDAFEYFLRNLTNGNKDLGEYYTPRHIIKMIVGLVDPKYGEKIYDPFCGTGGFLIEMFKYLSLRSDMTNEVIRETVKSKSLYGREISSTARVAKMNMILFGDGSTNIKQMDSLEKPVKNKYNVAISNIPYSQESEYGSLYKLGTTNGDAICVKHMWDSLVEGGRLAVVVPETFLYEDGIVKEVRSIIHNNSSSISIISLPRGVFNPYTPTKTSVIIATKQSNSIPKDLYFYVVDNDGFELGARRRPLNGTSDLRLLKEFYINKVTLPPKSIHVEQINNNYSFLPYDYMEHIPKAALDNGKYLKEVISEKNVIKLRDIVEEDSPVEIEIAVLEVSQRGISLSEITTELESYQKHIVVKAGDIVFNPHRINVGSIGRVPNLHTSMVVSPIYEVFNVTNESVDANFLLTLLKSKEYKSVINHYAKGGARPSFKVEELEKVKIPELTQSQIKEVKKLSNEIDEAEKKKNEAQLILENFISYGDIK